MHRLSECLERTGRSGLLLLQLKGWHRLACGHLIRAQRRIDPGHKRMYRRRLLRTRQHHGPTAFAGHQIRRRLSDKSIVISPWLVGSFQFDRRRRCRQ